ncbi:MAG: ATP-binding protein [Alphaproteobacteria bacterium]
MSNIDTEKLLNALERIASALEKEAGLRPDLPCEMKAGEAYIWDAQSAAFMPVKTLQALEYDLLVGIDDQRQTLHDNTEQFAKGFAANNALLWGARGTGKSSLVKAVFKNLAQNHPLVLIEIHREDIASLGHILAQLDYHRDKRFILFCDDLSFDEQDSSYKSLKAVLDGGIQSAPDHILFYATSNRRHLLPRDMMENERRTAVHGGEAVEEKISLSDRFGLWLGFYPCDQEDYFAMVENYARALNIEYEKDTLHAKALEWSMLRGARSGRVAWQFIQDLAGKSGKAAKI